MIDIARTEGEIVPYLAVKWPEGYWAFESKQTVDGWPLTTIQVIAPDGDYKNVWWARSGESPSTRNFVASEMALWLAAKLYPSLKMNDRIVQARKLRNG